MKKIVIQHIALLISALFLPSIMFATENYTAASVSNQNSSLIYNIKDSDAVKYGLKVGDEITDPRTGKKIQIPKSTTQLHPSEQNFVNALLKQYPTLEIVSDTNAPLVYVFLNINHHVVKTYLFSYNNTSTNSPKNINFFLSSDIMRDMVTAKKYRTGPFANLEELIKSKKVTITAEDKSIQTDTYEAIFSALNDPRLASAKLKLIYSFDGCASNFC